MQPIAEVPNGLRVLLYNAKSGLHSCGRITFHEDGSYDLLLDVPVKGYPTHFEYLKAPIVA